MYFQSLNSLLLVCILSILPLILKKERKDVFVNSMQEAGCIYFASSGSLLLSQSFSMESADKHSYFIKLLYFAKIRNRNFIFLIFCLTFWTKNGNFDILLVSSILINYKNCYPYIFATQCRRPWIFQALNSLRFSLKCQRFTPSGC